MKRDTDAEFELQQSVSPDVSTHPIYVPYLKSLLNGTAYRMQANPDTATQLAYDTAAIFAATRKSIDDKKEEICQLRVHIPCDIMYYSTCVLIL